MKDFIIGFIAGVIITILCGIMTAVLYLWATENRRTCDSNNIADIIRLLNKMRLSYTKN